MRSSWGNDRGYGGSNQWLPLSLHSIPVTRALLIATVVTFLLFFFTGQDSSFVARYVPFIPEGWYYRPWTLFTYPFLELPSIWILLALYVLYGMGGMLERAWGSRNFAALFFAFTAIGAVAFLIPYYLFGVSVPLLGLHIPLAALVTAWAALDPELEVSFWGFPLKAKVLAGVWVALIYFQMGMQLRSPLLALFVLAAPAAAYFYVRKLPRLNLSRLSLPQRSRPAPRRREPLLREEPAERERERVSGFNPLRKRQEQAEIERLRKLLGEDDEDRPARRH
ncbi:MAG: rhomboid family intramembrane serine protease [Armatimonadota bacterium]